MSEYQEYTTINFVRGIVPNASLSDDAILGAIIQAGADPECDARDLTERERDLCTAYIYLRLATNPHQSARVTDRDADWEHSEGSEQWSAAQLQQFLILARKLLEKWGVDTTLVDDIIPQWGFVGRNMRNPMPK